MTVSVSHKYSFAAYCNSACMRIKTVIIIVASYLKYRYALTYSTEFGCIVRTVSQMYYAVDFGVVFFYNIVHNTCIVMTVGKKQVFSFKTPFQEEKPFFLGLFLYDLRRFFLPASFRRLFFPQVGKKKIGSYPKPPFPAADSAI